MNELVAKVIFNKMWGTPTLMDVGHASQYSNDYFLKDYSNNILHAWDIVEKYSLGIYRSGPNWVVYVVDKFEGIDEELAASPNPAMAICIAGLQLAGLSEEDIVNAL